MYMHLTERGKLAKPLDIYTYGVKKIKHYFVCIKVKQARVLQPDPRSSGTATHYCTRDLQTRALQKNVISPLLYTFLACLNV